MLFSPKHILVPVAVDSEQDLELAKHAVLVACDIAQKFSSKLSLLHLTSLPQPGAAALDVTGELYRSMDEIVKDKLRFGDKKLSELKELAKNLGVSVDSAVIESLEDTAQAILSSAAMLKVDLLIMSAHERVGLSKLFFGSVTVDVVKKATLPVLILHPDAPKKVPPVKK